MIPNYKTPELTKICLRLIRKNTAPDDARVIVIDNDSGDESLDYLRSLSWVELLERPRDPAESAKLSHSRALDLALRRVDTPYLLSIHTDTLVRHPCWLQFLVAQIEKDDNIAGVGSWKLEQKPFIKRVAKKLEDACQSRYYQITAKKDHALKGERDYYLRSHCALYRTALLKKYNLGFSDGGETAGKALHHALRRKGHHMVFIPPSILLRYLEHVNHATTVLNSEFRSRKGRQGKRRVAKALRRFDAEKILKDTSLDD